MLLIIFAHGHGIIHRDIKPDNVIVTTDEGLRRACRFSKARTPLDRYHLEPEPDAIERSLVVRLHLGSRTHMKITVPATETKQVQVQVDVREASRALAQQLLAKFGMSPDQWVNDQGQLLEDDEHYHGSVTSHVVRPASAEDIEVMKVAKAFVKLVNKYL